MSSVITTAQAQIIAELLANSGYIDDASDLLYDRSLNVDKPTLTSFVTSMDELIAACNQVLSEEEQISLNMAKTLEELDE